MKHKHKILRKQLVFKWTNFNKLFIVVGFVIGLITLYLNIHQSQVNENELKNKNLTESADLVSKFNDSLSKYPNDRIIISVENGKPIFKKNGGEFTETQVDDLLGIYNDLEMLLDKGLVNEDMAYGSFSYDVIKTYQNDEIKKYIQKLHQEDDEVFGGFQDLAELFIKKQTVY